MPSSPFARLDALLFPAPDPARLGFLTAQPFAHRGLHGGARVENSQAAFVAAIAGGFGIELDVQRTADDHAVVFHDATLERLTSATGRVDARTADELAEVTLSGTDQGLATLDAVLADIAGRVPVLVEVKAPSHDVAALCQAVAEAVAPWRDSVAVMSFNPAVGAWFAARDPATIRGLVATQEGEETPGQRLAGGSSRWGAVALARPQFLAWDVRDLPSALPARARAAGVPILTWTVRTAQQRAIAAQHADQPIFEQPCN